MQRLFFFETSIGTFFIERSTSGSFHAVYRDENLGTYARPEEVAQDLAGGHTYPVFSGEDTSKLGIPANLQGWNRCE
jgi:hypothetical protein